MPESKIEEMKGKWLVSFLMPKPSECNHSTCDDLQYDVKLRKQLKKWGRNERDFSKVILKGCDEKYCEIEVETANISKIKLLEDLEKMGADDELELQYSKEISSLMEDEDFIEAITFRDEIAANRR
jgi:hypothetical protein